MSICKSKLLFKIMTLWKLAKSNSYCLITHSKSNKDNGIVETSRLNIFTEMQNSVILNLSTQFCKTKMHNDNMNSTVEEAKHILNLK